MKHLFFTGVCMMACLHLYSQEKMEGRWSLQQCIQYAVKHNHEVRLQQYTLNDYKAERTRAIGSFLPAISGSVNGQYNFGRAVDPETNIYTNVSTFHNGYSLSASIPLFDGLMRFHELKMAKANLLKGKHGVSVQKDAVALKVIRSFMDVQYYQGMVEMAERKREESESLLRKTLVMLEVGTKGEADVAQMRATVAADDYEVTRQQHLLSKAILTLKEQMNFPIADSLALSETEDWNAAPVMETAEQIYEQAQAYHPQILQAEQAFQAAKYSFRAAKGAFSPTISLGAGVSTSYYKNLDSPNALTFGEQWKNNAGQYLFATLSIPLFNRLNTLMNVRKQRNNLRRAKESLDYQHTELQRLITEAVFEQQNSWKETEKMQLKMESDSIASLLTIRKWEEGLASPIDVQTATVILLQSRAQLLQCRLTYSYNTHLLNYYKGVPLWTE